LVAAVVVEIITTLAVAEAVVLFREMVYPCHRVMYQYMLETVVIHLTAAPVLTVRIQNLQV
jgi:hypothetical protein